MSVCTRALAIPGILTQVFVHVSEQKTSWPAASANLAWWSAAQYAACLTRGRVRSDPDPGEHVVNRMDSAV